MSFGNYHGYNSSKVNGVSSNTRISTKETVSKFPQIQPIFFANSEGLLSTLKNLPEAIRFLQQNFSFFVKIDEKSGSTFFLFGFLLIQELIFQTFTLEKSEFQRFIQNCFLEASSQPKIDTIQKTLLKIQMKKLDDFLLRISQKSQASLFDERFKVAKLLCEQLKEDKELGPVLTQLGRCSIIRFLVVKNLVRFHQGLFSKLINKGWENDELYGSSFLDIFSEGIGFKITSFLIKQGKISSKVRTSDLNKFEAEIFENGALKIILFRSKNSLSLKESSQISFKNPRSEPQNMNLENNFNQEFERDSIISHENNFNFKNNSSEIIHSPINGSQFKTCFTCEQDIIERLVFTNPYCRHNFCYYCIQDFDNLESSVCFLTECNKKMDAIELHKFYKNCGENESSKPISYNFVPDEGSINSKPEDFSTFSNSNSKNFQNFRNELDLDVDKYGKIDVNNPNLELEDSLSIKESKIMVSNGKEIKNINTRSEEQKIPSNRNFENSCSSCKDFRNLPKFLNLSCGHKLCEFCILLNIEEFKKRGIKCLLCYQRIK